MSNNTPFIMLNYYSESDLYYSWCVSLIKLKITRGIDLPEVNAFEDLLARMPCE
jgi:hypothetical protein